MLTFELRHNMVLLGLLSRSDVYVELAAAGEAALNITLRWTNKTTTRRASLALAPFPLILS